MFDKIFAAKKKMEEVKLKLEQIEVTATAEGVTVIASASKKIKSIQISTDLMHDNEQLEDLIIVAVNKALENAENVSDSEMKAIASQILPGMDSMLGIK